MDLSEKHGTDPLMKTEKPLNMQNKSSIGLQEESSPIKRTNVDITSTGVSHYQRDSSSSSLKRDSSHTSEEPKDIGAPERKRLKSESTDNIVSKPTSQEMGSVKLSKLIEADNNKESCFQTKHSTSESKPISVTPPVYKNIKETSEEATSKHSTDSNSDLGRDSVEEAMGKLFGSTVGTPTKCSKSEGVTISPVRSKDLVSTGVHSSVTNTPSGSVSPHSNASRLKSLPSSYSGSEKSSVSSTVTSNCSSKGLESRLPTSPSVSNSGSSIGSVTITKLSTGSSLNVKSKDLKNILSASTSDSKSASLENNVSSSSNSLIQQTSKNKLIVSKAHGVHDIPFDNNGFTLKNPKVDLVPISSMEGMGAHQIGGMESPSLSIQSIGEKQGGDSGTRKSINLSPNSDSSSSSISSISSSGSSRTSNEEKKQMLSTSTSSSATTSNSRSNSPGKVPSLVGPPSNSSPSSQGGSKKISTTAMVSGGASKVSSPSSKSANSITDSNDQRNKAIKCKLIRDSKDELHIEGRPKLSIRKVPTPECGAIVNSPSAMPRHLPGGSISIVPERKSSSAGGGKPMAKLKLSEGSNDHFKRDRDPFAMSKGGSTSNASSIGFPFHKTEHPNKKQQQGEPNSSSSSSLTTSSKHSASLSIVSASGSSSNNSRSLSGGSGSSSSTVKTINFSSHHNHGGKPITMKSVPPSSSSKSSSPSTIASSMSGSNSSKTLSTSSGNSSTKSIASDVVKNDFPSSKLKIKLSVSSSGNNGQEGKGGSSETSSNTKSSSDIMKAKPLGGSLSEVHLDAKGQFTKGSGNSSTTDCDSIEPIQKSSSAHGPNSETGLLGDHEPPSGFPSFDFAGKPTYSPSRVEPITSMVVNTATSITTNSNATNTVQPTKESPRDASNKDSPASQADSGVFSIASSNSPSKDRDGGSMGSSGSTGTASTSPDSPNRIDRMPTSFGDQNFGSSNGNVGVGLNSASRDTASSWKPSSTSSQSHSDNLTSKHSVQQHSSTSYSKSSSLSDNLTASKPSNDKCTFPKSIPSSETSSSSLPLSGVSSKCSALTTTSSSQNTFTDGSKTNPPPGTRDNVNPNNFQQQRQQALQHQQMMQQGFSNGPNPSVSRPSTNTESSGYPSMYNRPEGGSFPNVGGRPPYAPGGNFSQRGTDFFGYNPSGSTGAGIGRGGETPAKRKRGRPRKAGMGGLPGDPTKPPKRSYVRKKKPESSQVSSIFLSYMMLHIIIIFEIFFMS